MQDLSLHILDIVQNSIRAHAKQIIIRVHELPSENQLVFKIEDNGDGIPQELVEQVGNPFVTTRTLRRVGLGIPLLKQNCDYSEGKLKITSEVGKGTVIEGYMMYDHIDRIPMGDIVSTIITLIQANPTMALIYDYRYEKNHFIFNSEEIKRNLGDVPINHLDVLLWLKTYLEQNIQFIKK